MGKEKARTWKYPSDNTERNARMSSLNAQMPVDG
jgi:hypothetical protein